MTASDGHYPDAFSLHAFDYVTKPFTLERIDHLISEIVDHTPIDAIFIKITVGSVDERIYLKNIVSVTTDGHYLEIHKDDGSSSRVRLTSGEFLRRTLSAISGNWNSDYRYNPISTSKKAKEARFVFLAKILIR